MVVQICRTIAASSNLLFLFVCSFMIGCHKEKNPDLPPPVIHEFSPAAAAKDSLVVIKGVNFSSVVAENKVTINDIDAPVVAATVTQITIKVPVHAGDGKIKLQIGNTTAVSAADFNYLYTVSTFAGNGETGSDDGPDTTARFFSAFGLTTDAAGNIIVADAGNNKIRRITPGGLVSTIAGDGSLGSRNGLANTAQFNFPRGVATDRDGNIFIADAGNNLIRKITPAGVVSTVAGNGTDGFADGPDTMAKFSFPVDLLVDGGGNIFVTDGNNARIRKITPQGVVSTVGNVIPGFPEGIDIDGAGNLYIANAANHVIQKMTPQGILETIAGTSVPGRTNGPANMAMFVNPEGLAIDANGNLYVGDLGNSIVRKITPSGQVTTFAGAQRGFADGLALTARFNEPSGITVDKSGTIYVADVNNLRIRKIE